MKIPGAVWRSGWLDIFQDNCKTPCSVTDSGDYKLDEINVISTIGD